jgi:hypothetical protein
MTVPELSGDHPLVAAGGHPVATGSRTGPDDPARLEPVARTTVPAQPESRGCRWRSARLVGSNFRIAPRRLDATVAPDRQPSRGPGDGLVATAALVERPGPPPPRHRPRPGSHLLCSPATSGKSSDTARSVAPPGAYLKRPAGPTTRMPTGRRPSVVIGPSGAPTCGYGGSGWLRLTQGLARWSEPVGVCWSGVWRLSWCRGWSGGGGMEPTPGASSGQIRGTAHGA